MRKVLFALVTAALLAGGAAFAQGMSNMYAGISVGVASVQGVFGIPVTAHFGVENVGMQNLDIRADAGFYITGTGLELGVEGIYNYPVMESLNVYGGLGPRVLIDVSGGGTWFGFAALGGTEYMVTPNIGLTGEVTVEPYFGSGGGVVIGAHSGVSYHF